VQPALALVVNAAARAVKRRYLRRDPFWQRSLPAALVRVTAGFDELEHAIAAFQRENVRAIAALGGDGTQHYVIDAVARQYAESAPPIILALAGGTMNGIPRALGTGGKPEAVLRQTMRDLAGGTPHIQPRHVLRVADARSGRVRHGFSFATGIVYRAMQQYYGTSGPGWIAAIRASLLPLSASLDGVTLQVSVAGAPWLAEPPHTLVASVFENPLLWFRPFGPPLENRSAFHLGATAMHRREIVPRLWSVFRGTCRHPRLRVGSAEEVVVGGAGDIGYVIDGELYGPDGGFDVRLSAGPEIRFVALAR